MFNCCFKVMRPCWCVFKSVHLKNPYWHTGEQVWKWQRPILRWNGSEENGEKNNSDNLIISSTLWSFSFRFSTLKWWKQFWHFNTTNLSFRFVLIRSWEHSPIQTWTAENPIGNMLKHKQRYFSSLPKHVITSCSIYLSACNRDNNNNMFTFCW